MTAEAAFGDALVLIASGETRDATRGLLIDGHPSLTPDQVNDIIEDALKDALKQGVEKEDIDESWFP